MQLGDAQRLRFQNRGLLISLYFLQIAFGNLDNRQGALAAAVSRRKRRERPARQLCWPSLVVSRVPTTLQETSLHLDLGVGELLQLSTQIP
jgi:hypothetical protein